MKRSAKTHEGRFRCHRTSPSPLRTPLAGADALCGVCDCIILRANNTEQVLVLAQIQEVPAIPRLYLQSFPIIISESQSIFLIKTSRLPIQTVTQPSSWWAKLIEYQTCSEQKWNFFHSSYPPSGDINITLHRYSPYLSYCSSLEEASQKRTSRLYRFFGVVTHHIRSQRQSLWV